MAKNTKPAAIPIAAPEIAVEQSAPVQYNLTVASVSVSASDDNVFVTVRFAENFPGITVDELGISSKVDINYLSMTRSRFIAMIGNADQRVSLFLSHLKDSEKFNGTALFVLLKDAMMTVSRQFFNEGEEYVDAMGKTLVHAHDGFNTEFVGIQLTDNVEKKVAGFAAKFMDSLFDL